MSPEPPAGPEHELTDPLLQTERVAVERALVRCHVLARLPPPARIAWFGSRDAAERYADAAMGRHPGPAPVPTWSARPGPSARVRRFIAAPRAGLFGLVFGIGFGLFATLILVGLPFWLLGLGLPLACFAGVRIGMRKLTGLQPRIMSALRTASVIGVVAAILALLGWLAGFPEGTFLLPQGVLQWLVPGTVGLVGLAGAVIGVSAARGRLRTAGARPDIVATFAHLLEAAAWRAGVSRSGRDPLGRYCVGWRPIPPRARIPAGSAGSGGAGLWRRARGAYLRRRFAAVAPAGQVLWRAVPGLVVVVEPPREIHSGPSGLDRFDGPALVWADGTAEYFLRGVRMPRSPALGRWSIEEIHAVPNSEVRRVMIEAIGWDEYLRQAQLRLVADAPDPGNPPHRIELYDLPEDVFGPVRLLVMVNGSPDRSGSPRRYAEYVPDDIDDPVEAAAWQYGVGVEVYRDLQRRT